MWNLSFCHWTYCRLLNQSSELANKYRADCWLKKEKPVVLKEENIMPTKEVSSVHKDETKDFSRDDLKELLSKSDITYFKWLKTEKLLQLCIENKLI